MSRDREHDEGRDQNRAGDHPGAEAIESELDPDRSLVLSAHADLKTRAHGIVLVLPERAIRVGGSGGEILELFDDLRRETDAGRSAARPSRTGRTGRTGREIVETLRLRYPEADPRELALEVGGFLRQMLKLGGLEAASQGAGGRPSSQDGATRADRERRAPMERDVAMNVPTPLNLIAELTYRCPLRCPYCSNPLDFDQRREALSAADWGRVFEEAAALGVVHLGLTGGEPSVRSDLEEILERAVAADLYPHLVTAGRPLDPERLSRLATLGLRSVQVSIQDATAGASDRIAGTTSFEQKLAICERTRELGLALTLNCVLHRHNLASVPAMIALARRFDADRLELANTQYHGWALRNRAALMPARAQLDAAAEAVRAAEAESDRPAILFVRPDYYSDRPKPCMGGWGRLAMVVDPTGRLLPCHDAATIPGLELWNVQERSVEACWAEAPGMQAFRGTDWMAEPCRSCPAKERDFGGCRCQAFALLGDAGATDPACALSPEHERVVAARRGTGRERPDGDEPLVYRGR